MTNAWNMEKKHGSTCLKVITALLLLVIAYIALVYRDGVYYVMVSGDQNEAGEMVVMCKAGGCNNSNNSNNNNSNGSNNGKGNSNSKQGENKTQGQ